MGSSSSMSVASEENQKDPYQNMKKKYIVQRTPIGVEFRNSSATALKPVGKRGKITPHYSPPERTFAVSVEMDRFRKEFEMFKLNTENEFANLEKVIKKYEGENQRLRGEVQALEKMVSKLKLERDQAVEAEMRALERASAFELDRNKIQKQFKIYRETREAELQGMLKTIKEQEACLVKLPSTSASTKCPHVKLTDKFGKNELKKWSSVESETSNESGSLLNLHENVLKANSYLMMLMDLDDAFNTVEQDDENLNLIHTKYSQPLMNNLILEELILYIAVASGMDSVIHEFVHCLPLLENFLSKYGKMLTIIHSIHIDANECNKTTLHPLKEKLIAKSTIFIVVFGEEINLKIKNEALKCHDLIYSQKMSKVCLLLENIFQKEPLSVINPDITESFTILKYESLSKIPDLIFSSLLKKLESYFTKSVFKDEDLLAKVSREEAEVEMCQRISNGIALDICDVALQWSLFINRLNLPVDVIPEKYMNYLTTYVMQPGPLSPLLVMGPSGSGRSTLLAKWIARMQDHFIVLHHSVISKKSSSSNPFLIMRKFLVRILEKMSPSYLLSTNPTRMKSEFLFGLEKVASKSDMKIIIVLDSIDISLNVENELSWLLDPLPVNVRIVISADPQHCPSSWRPWPTLYLEYPCQFTIKNILNHYCSQMKNKLNVDLQSRILKKLHSMESSLTLLFIDVFCRIVTDIGNESEDALDNIIDTLLECSTEEELFVVILEDFHTKMPDMHCQILCEILGTICVSSEGVRLSDLPFIISSFMWEWWDDIMEKLVFFQLICNSFGVLIIEHEQARTAVDYFCFQENKISEQSLQEQLANYYISKTSLNSVSDHLANELPKLLKEFESKERMKDCCSNIWIFYSLYSRGRTYELEEYYKFLKIDITDVISVFLNNLNQLENLMTCDGYAVNCCKIADMYEALGHYLQDLQLFSQAVMPLQRTVELRETLLDPDHPLVGEALHHLGILQSQWGNYSTALTIHKQALDIFETAFGKDHSLVAMELNSIIVINQHLGKIDVVPIMQERIKKMKKTQRNCYIYQNIATVLAIPFCVPAVEISGKSATSLNQMGVRMFWLHNYILAEKIFLTSYKIRRQLFGPTSVHISISLNNLAGIHVNLKNFKKAEQLYEEALAIRLDCLEVNSPLTSSIITRLGSLYQQQNKFTELLALYRRLLEIRKEKLKNNDPCIASAMVNLAVILSKQNIYDEALSLYEQALKIFLKLYREDHPQVLTTMRNLALLHYKQGHCEIAAELYKRATELQISHISTHEIC